ncbi:MAG: hypothetical protein AAFV88_08530 [Planctomycetota bacterium]
MNDRPTSSALNPFRAPLDEASEPPPSTGELLPDQALVELRTSVFFCLISVGFMSLFCVSLGVTTLLQNRSSLLETISTWSISSLLRTVVAIPLAALLTFGVSYAARATEQKRVILWMGSMLFYVGGAGVMGIWGTLATGGRFLGLTQLFGASCYAAMLTGVALYAIQLRHVASRLPSTLAARFFEVTILLLGTAAGTVSILVMGRGIPPETRQLLNFASFAVIVAVAVLLAAIVVLRRSIRLELTTRGLSSGSRNG